MFSVYLSSDNDVLYLTSAYNFSTVKSITTNYILNNVATTNGKSAYIFVTLAILNRSVFRYFYEDAMKFLIKDFLRKCDQISRKLRICSHLLEKSSLENFIFLMGPHTYLIYERCLNFSRTGEWESNHDHMSSLIQELR